MRWELQSENDIFIIKLYWININNYHFLYAFQKKQI